MTVLSAIQRACSVIGVEVPTGVYASTSREYVELADLANEMAKRIVSAHEWQALTTLATITGDGSTKDFDLPSDYDRMLTKAQMWSSTLRTPLSHIPDLDQWLGLDVQSFTFVINAWTLYGGQVHIKPAPASGVTIKYYYQSKNIGASSTAVPLNRFTADTDTFSIDDRLLTLGIIWQWRANKGLPYAEDMNNYEDYKEKLISRDKGSRMIRVGTIRLPKDVNVAYPQNITV